MLLPAWGAPSGPYYASWVERGPLRPGALRTKCLWWWERYPLGVEWASCGAKFSTVVSEGSFERWYIVASGFCVGAKWGVEDSWLREGLVVAFCCFSC